MSTVGREVAPETLDALLVLERMDEGFYAIDRQWQFLYVNRSAELFWGLERANMLGRSMLEIFPAFEGSPAHRAHAKAIASDTPARTEVISTATGTPVELRLFPTPAGLSVYFHDITKRRQMEEDLRTRNELLTLAELSAGIGVWVSDLRTGTVVATPQFFSLLGIPPVEGPFPADLPRRYRHPDDRDRISEGFQSALARGDDTYDSEYRIVRPNGEVRWIFGRGRITRDEAGIPWRYAGVDIDITSRREQEDHLRVVMKELLHRTNNLLTVIEALARQTAAASVNLDDFIGPFTARLHGLGESSNLLARQEWRGAALDDLILAQVASFAPPARFELSGPRVVLSPKAVQNLGLAFHELATNATKYGALSVPSGKVAVTWRVDGALHLAWKEQQGPRVKTPTRAGFGRIVTEKIVAASIGAEVATAFAPEGLEWTAVVPAGEFHIEPGPGDR